MKFISQRFFVSAFSFGEPIITKERSTLWWLSFLHFANKSFVKFNKFVKVFLHEKGQDFLLFALVSTGMLLSLLSFSRIRDFASWRAETRFRWNTFFDFGSKVGGKIYRIEWNEKLRAGGIRKTRPRGHNIRKEQDGKPNSRYWHRKRFDFRAEHKADHKQPTGTLGESVGPTLVEITFFLRREISTLDHCGELRCRRTRFRPFLACFFVFFEKIFRRSDKPPEIYC